MKELPIGIYDLLHTKELNTRLDNAGLLERSVWYSFGKEELKYRLVIPLA